MIGDQERAAGLREVLESFPLDPEPVLVDRVERAPGQRAEVLAAAPPVDVGTPDFRSRIGLVRPTGEWHQITTDDRFAIGIDTGEVEVGLRFGRELERPLSCPLRSVGHGRSLWTECSTHQHLSRNIFRSVGPAIGCNPPNLFCRQPVPVTSQALRRYRRPIV